MGFTPHTSFDVLRCYSLQDRWQVSIEEDNRQKNLQICRPQFAGVVFYAQKVYFQPIIVPKGQFQKILSHNFFFKHMSMPTAQVGKP